MHLRLLIACVLLMSWLAGHAQISHAEGFLVDTFGRYYARQATSLFACDSIDWWYLSAKRTPEFSSTFIDLTDKKRLNTIERSALLKSSLKENETAIFGSAWVTAPMDLAYSYFGKRATVAIKSEDTHYSFRFRVKRTSSGELWIRKQKNR